MITKAQLLEVATSLGLLPTTVEKDYALGWLLAAISRHEELSRWAFKGGTCLKKCFFETYRFSEDLDFTIPSGVSITAEGMGAWLGDAAEWVETEAGLQFPREKIEVERYTNPRERESFQAKLSYVGLLGLPRRSLQRVKLDLTQDEWLGDETELRTLFHPYDGELEPAPNVRCYSVNEILAEKTRALYERQGRARDLYDIVHLSREFRDSIEPQRAAELARRKFTFKELPPPSVVAIMERIDQSAVRRDWQQQLAHQLPVLPPVDGFLQELPDAISWWLEPALAAKQLEPITTRTQERAVPRQRFPARALGVSSRVAPSGWGGLGSGSMDRIRYAARNRLCAEVRYQGVNRLVEPYSLRLPDTGNLLLYVFELSRSGAPSRSIKAYKVAEIQAAQVTGQAFSPQFAIEL